MRFLRMVADGMLSLASNWIQRLLALAAPWILPPLPPLTQLAFNLQGNFNNLLTLGSASPFLGSFIASTAGENASLSLDRTDSVQALPPAAISLTGHSHVSLAGSALV